MGQNLSSYSVDSMDNGCSHSPPWDLRQESLFPNKFLNNVSSDIKIIPWCLKVDSPRGANAPKLTYTHTHTPNKTKQPWTFIVLSVLTRYDDFS